MESHSLASDYLGGPFLDASVYGGSIPGHLVGIGVCWLASNFMALGWHDLCLAFHSLFVAGVVPVACRFGLLALWVMAFALSECSCNRSGRGNGGARLQEHSLSAPPDRFGLIAAFRLAVFRAVQENRPVETPGLASDVISLDFIAGMSPMLWPCDWLHVGLTDRSVFLIYQARGEMPNSLAVRSWIELVADDVNA